MAIQEERRQGYNHCSIGRKIERKQPYGSTAGKDTAMTQKEEMRQGYSHGSEGGKEARIQPWL